ncbi:methionyl-tRNA formyltransferase [Bdellovibrio bacteriovorus]|uniref:Methionyl-tRNA formyltransferase n=1 Tax=Bdellovibrio bacteriovorus TaxID=959 RepID=A0A150WFB5_BDEBC|nr:methionyl-tRNA formyltransferase [Bdellovibrio bacteriovorus]KYG61788.1 methionyl-tRNA formyltransferase [Bdellovibrio bacteriovorus]
MSKVRVCFLGTPEFAVTSLQALLKDEHFEVVGVVTQPDRPAGRKLQLTPSPVKVLAQEHNLKVISPESLKADAAAVAEIASWGAEVGVVVAFGQILTQSFLDSFRFGCVNVHGSVLPRWRGAAPIQRAIEAGDLESGVTLQKMVKKLDAGDIIGIRRVKITPEMNALELHDKLAELGADLLRVELMDYVRGNLAPTPQDESQVTIAKKIEKHESQVDWNLSAKAIDGKIRGFVYGPGVFTLLQGKKLKLHKAIPVSGSVSAEPGSITTINADHLSVATGDGILKIYEVQPESRNRMKVADFLKGHDLKVGDKLGV